MDSQTRRFFVHRPLRVYHTEGDDRVSAIANRAPLEEKVAVFCAVGEDHVYLRLLRGVAPAEHRRLMMRVWAARVLRSTLFRRRGRR